MPLNADVDLNVLPMSPMVAGADVLYAVKPR
jgi:hypothetical protein